MRPIPDSRRQVLVGEIRRWGAVRCGSADFTRIRGRAMLTGTRAVLVGHLGEMISIAVKGYGIVIWDGDGEWRTFAASDAHSAMLARRVELALSTPSDGSDDAICSALLSISGAHLLAVDCDHPPGGCDGETEHN